LHQVGREDHRDRVRASVEDAKGMMQTPANTTLFDYWNDIRGERVAPRRFEIEPSRISHILPDTFILERHGEASFRYRLAGTRICETFETELRGKDMVSGWTGADADTLQRWLRLVCERHAAVRFVFECQAPAARRSIAYECLLLPLFHTSQRVDRILGAMAPLDAPDWAGPLDLGPPSISDFEVVWPDGAPRRVGEPCEPVPFVPSHAGLPSQAGLLSQGGEPSALRPAVRVARIVRQDRRQFRVYDGGRG